MIGVFYMKMLIYVNIGVFLFDIYLLYNYLWNFMKIGEIIIILEKGI